MTVEELAERAGVGASHISHYEAGRRRMSPGRLSRVLDALGAALGAAPRGSNA